MSGPVAVENKAARPLLLDTHVLVRYLEGSCKIGKKTFSAIESAAELDSTLVSAITPWEIALLVSKGRLQLEIDVLDWVRGALARPGLQLVPLAPEISIASTRFSFEMHADPADRILVATARQLGATLVTADAALLRMAGKGHFRAMDAES